MLKVENPRLRETLKALNIPIKSSFNPAQPWGYHRTDDIASLIEFASSNGYYINKLGEDELIISSSPVWLGKDDQWLEDGVYFRTLFSIDEWLHLSENYPFIKNIPGVPAMEFPTPKLVLRNSVEGVTLWKANFVNSLHKEKLITFLKKMNTAGYVHRDLHCKNIIVSKEDLTVIDWDFLAKQKCDITDSYDLTGRGLPSPHLTGNTSIFKNYPIIKISSVADQLKIRIEDFKTHS